MPAGISNSRLLLAGWCMRESTRNIKVMFGIDDIDLVVSILLRERY
tara:strand:+ start:205 stop:342 length:138 start_codon:yes stop_codon:yes gene_type:complete